MAATVTGRLVWQESPTPHNSEAVILAVVLDHAHARLFLVDGEHAAELPCLVSPRMRGGKFHSDRQGSPGWGESGFQRRRREEERRHYAAVVRRLGVLTRAHGAQGLVLGGSHEVVAALQHALPPRLARMVVGTAALNPTELTSPRVLESVRALRGAAGLAAQEALVSAAVEGFAATGRAVDGLQDVLHALGRDQVHVLLVGRPRPQAGYHCETSGRLVLTKAEALGESVLRVGDLIAAAKVETVRLGGSVAEIRDPRQAARIDGVAALLRYR
jgi:peptide subunit release factor 1 (eRF1)